MVVSAQCKFGQKQPIGQNDVGRPSSCNASQLLPFSYYYYYYCVMSLYSLLLVPIMYDSKVKNNLRPRNTNLRDVCNFSSLGQRLNRSNTPTFIALI